MVGSGCLEGAVASGGQGMAQGGSLASDTGEGGG